MKNRIFLVLALVLAIMLAGCWGKQKPSVSQPIPTPTPGYSQGSSVLPEAGSYPEPGSAMPSPSSSRAAATAAALAEEEAWALRLVNPDHPLPEDFLPPLRLIQGYDTRQLDVRAADDLEALLLAAEKAGCPLYFSAGYRDRQRQIYLFKARMEKLEKAGSSKPSALQQAADELGLPDRNEYQLGLGADLVTRDWYSHHIGLHPDFEETDAFQWLQANAADYGFILRYPKDKQHITGTSYKPWHYRYVGKTAAALITAENLTLEEFCLKRGLIP